MRFLIKLFFVSIIIFSSSVKAELPQEAPIQKDFYQYANNESEYSIALPEAPSVKTLWADKDKIPYLDHPPVKGAVGETAIFKRVDLETNEIFDTEIIFIKAEKEFLNSLTKEKATKLLEADLKGIPLDNKSIDHVIGGKKELRRTSLTGFSVDRSNKPFYYAEHLLTGEQSILVIKVQYSIENKKFGEYYKNIIENINYLSL